MKKSILFSLSLVLMFSVANALESKVTPVTTLRIPTVISDENSSGKVYSAAEMNKELAAKNLPLIPEVIEIRSDAKSNDNYNLIMQTKQMIEESMAKLGHKDLQMAYHWVPGQLDTKENKTCYIGDPAEVPNLVGEAADSIYSDQYSLLGYRYKSVKYVENEDEDTNAYLNENSSAWKNYATKSSTVLLVAATNDDGTDINESLITVCK